MVFVENYDLMIRIPFENDIPFLDNEIKKDDLAILEETIYITI